MTRSMGSSYVSCSPNFSKLFLLTSLQIGDHTVFQVGETQHHGKSTQNGTGGMAITETQIKQMYTITN